MTYKNLPTIYVIDNNGTAFGYAIDQQISITLEDINKFVKEKYGDNFKEIRFGTTIGYLTKASYEK